MSLCKYFKLASALPTPKEWTVNTRNNRGKQGCREGTRKTEAKSTGRKRKYTSTFTSNNREACCLERECQGKQKVWCRRKHSSIVQVQVPSCFEGQSTGWGRGRHGGYTYWKTWPATSTLRAGQVRPEIHLCIPWCWGSDQYQPHNHSCRRHCDCTWLNPAGSA